LRTIVPSVAIIPGQGLPKENGVFLNANYAWTEFVSTGRYNHNDAYAKNWFQVNQDWFKSGRPFSEYDQVAGKNNPWFQKWLKHPTFDKFWQKMVPYKSEYAKIDIPVLSLTGYYDDAQISAIEFVKEHFKYHRNPNHHLVIGPYDHFNVDILQQEKFRGYKLDPVAHIDMRKLTFDWFNYVFEQGEKPKLLKDKINYQLMGDNSWRHAESIESLNRKGHKRYFSASKNEHGLSLVKKQPSSVKWLKQTIDMKDRTKTYNDFYYPFPVVRKSLEAETGFTFSTETFEQDMELSGTISGELKVKINKKDFDFGIVLFEQKADGSLHHLNYYIGRASHAKDPESRQLLMEGKIETVPFEKARMISKKISKGSRLLVLLNVNFNSFSQVNYGTGKDIAKENIKDAEKTLKIEWLNSSFIHLPLSEFVN
ncbi:MAG: CocE/NonD family hydrolase, partial [Kangiellaceae bacterium]|nr:CocE/NonD family hydrolase [Kangiellaceae bacterium]